MLGLRAVIALLAGVLVWVVRTRKYRLVVDFVSLTGLVLLVYDLNVLADLKYIFDKSHHRCPNP